MLSLMAPKYVFLTCIEYASFHQAVLVQAQVAIKQWPCRQTAE